MSRHMSGLEYFNRLKEKPPLGDEGEISEQPSSMGRAGYNNESDDEMKNTDFASAHGYGQRADLTEAERLLSLGFKLCKLEHLKKKPEGDGWQLNPIREIDERATGYGVILGLNGLGSIDPDNVEPAREGMRRCGFDLDELMAEGVRTSSTRPGSGGRSTFKVPPDLRRIKFASKKHGTMLELRAGNTNLQDCLPGTIYVSKDGEGLYRQDYANGKTFDEAPEIPAPLLAWWRRMNDDLAFKREQQALFYGDEGGNLDVSGGVGKGAKLAFASQHRTDFNANSSVEDIIARHAYTTDGGGRWAPATATGAPCVRPIPGCDGLWQSDHASDPLCGTFDAWTAHVVLDHAADLAAAEAGWLPIRTRLIADEFPDVDADVRATKDYVLAMIENNDIEGSSPDELVSNVERELAGVKGILAEAEVKELIGRLQAVTKRSPEELEQRTGLKDESRLSFYPYNVLQLAPTEFVVDGFLGIGLAVIAGMPGVGKTSLLVPLAAVVAHLFDSPMRPVLRRRVIYFSESPRQVETVLYGLAKKAPGAKPNEFGEWLKVVPSHRMSADRLGKVVRRAVKEHTVTFNGYAVAPLIVLDTSNATVDLENENDNSEVGRAIAAIKENLGTGGCWLVQHIAKSLKRADVTEMTARGAGAFGGDAEATAFVFAEDEIPNKRFMWLDKHRFEAEFREIEFATETATETVETPWKTTQEITYRVGFPSPSDVASRKAQVEEHKERQQDERAGNVERQVRVFLYGKEPQSMRKISDGIGGRADFNYEVMRRMVLDGKLVSHGKGRGGGEVYAVGVDPDFED